MREVGLLVGVALLGAAWYALALWWFEARTTWMGRLSARGLLDGHYEPYRGGGWGSPRWLVRQRMALPDLRKVRVLEHETDTDGTTELWRIRALRRRRLLFVTAPGVLIGPFVLSALLARFQGAFVLALAFLAVAAWIPARALYRRVRAWGDYEADRSHRETGSG